MTTEARSKTGWPTTKSLGSGRFAPTKGLAGRVPAHGSIGLPNGDRINTVRRDIMDRALGRDVETKG